MDDVDEKCTSWVVVNLSTFRVSIFAPFTVLTITYGSFTIGVHDIAFVDFSIFNQECIPYFTYVLLFFMLHEFKLMKGQKKVQCIFFVKCDVVHVWIQRPIFAHIIFNVHKGTVQCSTSVPAVQVNNYIIKYLNQQKNINTLYKNLHSQILSLFNNFYVDC